MDFEDTSDDDTQIMYNNEYNVWAIHGKQGSYSMVYPKGSYPTLCEARERAKTLPYDDGWNCFVWIERDVDSFFHSDPVFIEAIRGSREHIELLLAREHERDEVILL